MNAYRLTRERRRAVCIHEAGHAVLHALGGAWVYRVAVAPEGATDWQTTSRKGAAMADLWGICSPSGGPAAGFIQWNADEGAWGADRRRFRELLRFISTERPRAKREMLRQVRAQVCGSLGGPVAEELHNGEEPCIDYEGEWGVFDDAKCALAHAWLLPWRGELEHLHSLTVAALRRPDVWAYVLRLADELERVGDIEEGLEAFLPAPVRDWPRSSMAKRPALLTVAPLVERVGRPQG